MSDYDDRPRRRHGGNRTREPEYVETEETYIQKSSGSGTKELAIRTRDDDYDDRDYPTEVRRRSYREEYAPPRRRARSYGYQDRGYHDDDGYDDYSTRSRNHRSSRYDDDAYSDDDYDRPRRDRRKSKVGEIVEGLGLGGVAAAVLGKSGRSRSKSRGRGRRHSSSDRSRYGSRARSKSARRKWQQAAQAALFTGVIEAVHSRKEPGGWTGAKGQRVATAALSAAGIDGFLDKDPDRKHKRHIVESVVGGLAATRLANGARESSEHRRGRSQSHSRSRSRSQSQSMMGRLRSRSRSVFGRGRSSSRGAGGGGGSGLKEVAALGGVAAVGKAIYDRMRSKSRGRTRRDRSVSSDDSRRRYSRAR